VEVPVMPNQPDVRGQYTFKMYVRNGKTYKQAFGWLGMPDQIMKHRSSSGQVKISGGTGDDAGHLIGNRFGSPGGAANLSLQNRKANRYGTYKDLENAWAAKRKAGIEVYVQVTDIVRHDESRPFMRNVQWIERAAGRESRFEVDFANPHTPESRLKQQIPPTHPGNMDAQVILVDFQMKRRLS
jgi:hypothetical protein